MFKIDNVGKYTVPKDLRANLKWRKELLLMAADDPEAQRQLYVMCEEDPLFWLGSFVWTYNPKNMPEIPADVPFIPYPFQEEAIYELCASMGRENIAVEKSRDMGASWICLSVFLYFWQFWRGFSFLCASRKEYLVDAKDNPDSLFWKMRYAITNQPGWLQPLWTTKKLSIANADNGNTIDGDSTTEDLARGGRRTAVLLDEAAAIPYGDAYDVDRSLHYVTDCLIKNSTPKGADGAYYDTINDEHCKKLTFHWSRHPVKQQGLYRVNDRLEVEIIDKEWHTKNPGYQFTLKPGKWDGLRSPWYDKKCKAATTDAESAQEMDIDYLGSNYMFFDGVQLNDHISAHEQEPLFTGELEYSGMSAEPKRFHERTNAPWKLWINLVGGRPPANRRYVIGADIAMGTGSSNSALSIVDRTSGEKVASYVNARITPQGFAQLAVAAAKFFNGAFLIWEGNGPGRGFGMRVKDLEYSNIYYRQEEMRLGSKPSDFPGWYSTPDSKRTLLGEYREALKENNFINHERSAVLECRKYLVIGEKIEHTNAVNIEDPTAARANHGDIVIADALACKGIKSKRQSGESLEPEPPVGSYGWRIQQHKKQKDEDRSWFAA